jgi:hypothetical protein
MATAIAHQRNILEIQTSREFGHWFYFLFSVKGSAENRKLTVINFSVPYAGSLEPPAKPLLYNKQNFPRSAARGLCLPCRNVDIAKRELSLTSNY